MGQQPISADSKLLRSAQAIYNAMEKDSVVDPESGMRYWEGALTEIYLRYGVTSSSYSRVNKVFSQTRSTEMIFRGGGGAPSRVSLLRFPSQDLYNKTGKFGRSVPNTQLGRDRVELGKVADELATAVAKIETLVTSVSVLHRNMNGISGRLAALEDEMPDLRRKPFRLDTEQLSTGQEPLETFDEGGESEIDTFDTFDTFDWEEGTPND